MCQHSSLWVACATTCELQIGNVMWAYDAIEYLQDMLGYALCLLYQFVIFDEAIVVSPDEADSLQVRQYRVQFFVL